MKYTPRTIAFICELLHLPLPNDPAPIQKVHNQMFESGQPAYSSFAVAQNGAILSNPASRPGAVSQATFLPDRFLFREELGHLTSDGFAQRVRGVSERVCELRGIRQITAQSVIVRTLVNPKSYKDSRTYLKEGMFGFEDEVENIGREPSLFGLRMVFGPTPDDANAFALRIESFNNDPRSLYLENHGTFGALDVSNGLHPIESNIESTYAFIVERALPFVGAFDARQEA